MIFHDVECKRFLRKFEKNKNKKLKFSSSSSNDESKVEDKINNAPSAHSASDASDASTPKMKPHQWKVVHHMLDNRGLIVAHTPGSGKTGASIITWKEVLEKDPSIPCIVAVVKSANQDHFRREARKWGLPSNFVFVTRETTKSKSSNSKKSKIELGKHVKQIRDQINTGKRIVPIYMMTKETLTNHYRKYIDPETKITLHTEKDSDDDSDADASADADVRANLSLENLRSFENVFFLVDEAHLLKTEIKLGLKKVKGIQAWTAIRCAKVAKKVLLLTGTPLPNDTYDIENLLAMVDGRDPMSKRIFKRMLIENRNLKKYLQNRISYYMCTWRNLPKELESAFPKVTEEKKTLYMSELYLEEYNKVEKQEELRTMQSRGLNTQNDPYIFYCGLRVASNNIDIEGEVNPKVSEIIRQTYSTEEKRKMVNHKTLIYSGFVKSGIGPMGDKLDEYVKIDPVPVRSTKATQETIDNLDDDGDDASKMPKKISYVDYERDGTGINSHPKRLYVEVSGNVKPIERELGVARYNAISGKEKVFFDRKLKYIKTVDINSKEYFYYQYLISLPDPKAKAKKFNVSRNSDDNHYSFDSDSSDMRKKLRRLDSNYSSKKDKFDIKNLPRYNLFDPVRFILIGPAGREGLDLKGTRMEFIMEPDWNESVTEQAISRGIRLHAHSHLIPEERFLRIIHLLLDKPRDFSDEDKNNNDNDNNDNNDHDNNDDEDYDNEEKKKKKITSKEVLERSGVDILMWHAIVEKQTNLNNLLKRMIKYSI